MSPKINGNSLADLVKQAVQREVAPQLKEMQELLQEALARITSLENEIVECKATPSAPRLPPSPSSSSSVCRHWLRNRCTWKEQCRFSHGEVSDADSEGSYSADINAKDLEEEEMLTKVAEATSSFSSCEVKMNSSEVVECLLMSNLPPRHQSVSGVLQPEPVGGALARTGFDSDVKPHGVLHCSLVEDLLGDILDKVVDSVVMRKEEEWLAKMSTVVDTIQAKFMAQYSPRQDGDIIHSAEVFIPRIDFSKVKPHLHKNLPKPNLFPVHSCSPDPTFYTDCHKAKRPNHDGCSGGCKPLFDMVNVCPFGSAPGFATNLGIVPIPQAPIGGYIYKGGTGDETTWQLYAEAVYL